MSKLIELIGQGKIRRSFHARGKLNYPGLVSHITQRAPGKAPLFIEDGDYLYMLKLIKEEVAEYNLFVLAFVLMTNHIHLLIRQNEKNLSTALQILFARYAVYFNKKYNRKGHVFCGRFRQAACFNDYYLLAASIYIHLNPVRAHIVEDYKHYRWSSWRLYCQKITAPTFVNWKFILKMLNKDFSLSRKRYRELLDESMNYRGKDAMEEKRAIGIFSIWLKKRFPEHFKVADGSTYKELLPDGYADDRELDRIIENLKMKKRLRSPGDIKARRFAIEQLKARGFDQTEIADYLSLSRATIYRILKS